MKTSQKALIISNLSKHIQGLISVANKCGLKVVGINSVIYASIETSENEYLYPLTENTTLSQFKSWLGY